MKVNSNRDISFKGFYNNRILQKSLELAADNGTLFAATASLGFSCARPAAIWLTPNVSRENKQIACVKSISSSGVGLGLTIAASRPLAKSITEIDKNPEKYLKPETIKTLQNGCNKLALSKSYAFATQLFKLGLGILIAAPKAILTSASMPYVMKAVCPNKHEKETPAFKGKNNLSKGIGKIIDKKGLQNFSEKYKNSNFPMHIIATTDIITTATFIHQTNKSKKIKEPRKKALIYNAGISTGLSILSGYILDKTLDSPTEKFIKKYKDINKANPNLEKQIEGIKIAKPILILGCVYYIFIPLISTFLAEIADNKFSTSNQAHK